MSRDIDQPPAEGESVPQMHFLKLLVGGLAVTMGLGILVIAAILWTRLGAAPLPQLPAEVALPQGATAAAVTFARDRLIVVTEGGEVLIYDRDGALTQRVAVK